MKHIEKQSKIKICHVLNGFENGGAEAVIFNYMTHMDLSKFDIHIIAHEIRVKECAERFEKIGCIIHIIPSKKKPISHMWQMYKILKNENFDILHIATTEWAFISAFIGILVGCQIRISHSHMAEHPKGIIKKMGFYLKILLGRIFANVYWACGEEAGRVLFGRKNYEQGKVTVFNNAIEINKYRFNSNVRDQIREELGIGKDEILVGNVGRFTKQKNHILLIDIFYNLVKINPECRLLLIGDGPQLRSVKEKAARLNVDNRIIFLGVREDVDRLYQAMDVLVMPSFMEGFPLVGIESQISGLRCVFSDQITKQIDISNNSIFIGLDVSSEIWAKIIVNCLDYDRKTLYCDDFDIHKQAMKMENEYLRLLKVNNKE